MIVLLYLISFYIFQSLLHICLIFRHNFVDPFPFLRLRSFWCSLRSVLLLFSIFIIIAIQCLYKQTSKKKFSWKKYVIVVGRLIFFKRIKILIFLALQRIILKFFISIQSCFIFFLGGSTLFRVTLSGLFNSKDCPGATLDLA